MRFCARLQLDRTRRVLDARQARIRKQANENARRRLARIPIGVTPARQLELAIAALDNQEAQQGRKQVA